jgi:signal peptidase I
MEQHPEKRQGEIYIPAGDVVELIAAVREKGADFRFKAPGGSMRPAIRNNDLVTLSPLQGLSPFAGEVVAFRHPQSNRLFLHRVIRKKEKLYFIRGDRLQWVDKHIPVENILGVVTEVERSGKTIFWPHRFHRPKRARFYFGSFLIYLSLRRSLKNLIKRCLR